MLDQLKARLEELRASEAQAIHGLGFVAGRIQELQELIARLEAEPSPPTVEHGKVKAETMLKAVETEKR
jgi:hypothetical protein